MYSAYKLNKQGDNIQPWHAPFPIWNQSVVPCPVLTVASWPAYRFLRRQVRWSGSPISLRTHWYLKQKYQRLKSIKPPQTKSTFMSVEKGSLSFRINLRLVTEQKINFFCLGRFPLSFVKGVLPKYWCQVYNHFRNQIKENKAAVSLPKILLKK